MKHSSHNYYSQYQSQSRKNSPANEKIQNREIDTIEKYVANLNSSKPHSQISKNGSSSKEKKKQEIKGLTKDEENILRNYFNQNYNDEYHSKAKSAKSTNNALKNKEGVQREFNKIRELLKRNDELEEEKIFRKINASAISKNHNHGNSASNSVERKDHRNILKKTNSERKIKQIKSTRVSPRHNPSKTEDNEHKEPSKIQPNQKNLIHQIISSQKHNIHSKIKALNKPELQKIQLKKSYVDSKISPKKGQLTPDVSQLSIKNDSSPSPIQKKKASNIPPSKLMSKVEVIFNKNIDPSGYLSKSPSIQNHQDEEKRSKSVGHSNQMIEKEGLKMPLINGKNINNGNVQKHVIINNIENAKINIQNNFAPSAVQSPYYEREGDIRYSHLYERNYSNDMQFNNENIRKDESKSNLQYSQQNYFRSRKKNNLSNERLCPYLNSNGKNNEFSLNARKVSLQNKNKDKSNISENTSSKGNLQKSNIEPEKLLPNFDEKGKKGHNNSALNTPIAQSSNKYSERHFSAFLRHNQNNSKTPSKLPYPLKFHGKVELQQKFKEKSSIKQSKRDLAENSPIKTPYSRKVMAKSQPRSSMKRKSSKKSGINENKEEMNPRSSSTTTTSRKSTSRINSSQNTGTERKKPPPLQNSFVTNSKHGSIQTHSNINIQQDIGVKVSKINQNQPINKEQFHFKEKEENKYDRKRHSNSYCALPAAFKISTHQKKRGNSNDSKLQEKISKQIMAAYPPQPNQKVQQELFPSPIEKNTLTTTTMAECERMGELLREKHIERIYTSIQSDREKIIKENILYLMENNEIPPTTLEHYKIIKLIGKGAFGKVTLGIHKLTGKYVAIKTINKSYIKDEFSKKKVLQEVYIHKKLRHHHIIRLLEVFEAPKHLLIVMEYAAGGDLLHYIKANGRLDESDAKPIFKQAAYGLAHIHSRSIIHRDIKLDNILLDNEGNVKICDFGVSKIIQPNTKIKEQCGTPAYLAPEIISSDDGYEGFFVDHWSLGILLYAIICAAVPYKAQSLHELKEKIMTTPLSFPNYLELTDCVKDLIASLLKINPYTRLSLPEVLNHEWLAEYSPTLTDDGMNSILSSTDCINPASLLQRNSTNPYSQVNIVNLGNLFYDNCKEATLFQSDYFYIANDFYSSKLNEETLNTLESFGYRKDIVIKNLQNGDLNHATATYTLLVMP